MDESYPDTSADDTKAMATLRQEWKAMARGRAGALDVWDRTHPADRDYEKMIERRATWDRRNDGIIDAWLSLRDERDWGRLARSTLMG
jgi:hypothetical protein